MLHVIEHFTKPVSRLSTDRQTCPDKRGQTHLPPPLSEVLLHVIEHFVKSLKLTPVGRV